MALLLRPKYLLVYKTRRGELKKERGEKRREEERRRREEKKKGRAKRYGTMTTSMNTCFGLYGATFDIWISCLAFDLSRVLLGFHPNPRFIENRGGKTLKGTR